MPMNNAEARIVDPILTEAVTGYTNADLIGNQLFPEVPVDASAGKRIEFGKESFKLYRTRRAPGGRIVEVDFGYEGKEYSIGSHALQAKVPYETQREGKAGPGIDNLREAVEGVMEIQRLALEYEQAQLAFNAANYDSDHKVTLSGSSKWSHADGDPILTIDTGREAIRASTGMEPNTLVLGAVAWKALKNNAKVKDSLATTKDKLVSLPFVADLLGVEKVVVGKAVYADDADAFADVWGNFACLAYVPRQGAPSRKKPSFGYTYVMRNHPFVEAPWYDKDTGSWKAPVHFERAPLLTGISSGYLVIAPN